MEKNKIRISRLITTVGRSAVIPVVVVGLILLFYSTRLVDDKSISSTAATIGLFLVSLASTIELYRYMQNVRMQNVKRKYPAFRSDMLAQREVDRQSNRLSNVETDLKALAHSIEALGAITAHGGGEVPEEVTRTLLKRVKEAATEEIVAEWAEKFGRTSIVEGHLRQIRESVQGAIDSLEDEIEALSKRSNVQMASGAIVSIVGFLVLGFFIYRAGYEIDVTQLDGKLAGYLFLRLSLVIMIELFALFFLRMYRYSVFEIKYFQNEISSIYLKAIAVEMAFMETDKGINKAIVSELIKSERNVILRKGDVSLAQLRDISEREGDAALLNFIKSVPDSLAGVARTLVAKKSS